MTNYEASAAADSLIQLAASVISGIFFLVVAIVICSRLGAIRREAEKHTTLLERIAKNSSPATAPQPPSSVLYPKAD